jgi:hypothetical protein
MEDGGGILWFGHCEAPNVERGHIDMGGGQLGNGISWMEIGWPGMCLA